MKPTTILIATLLLFLACKGDYPEYDATGVFEAKEIIISSEATGRLMAFPIEEGQLLEAGQQVGYIDTITFHLRKKQLRAQINALLSKQPSIHTQIAALQEQLQAQQQEQDRIRNLVKAGAATPKQLDDINAQVEIVKKELAARMSSLSISSRSLLQETVPLQVQIEEIDNQISKCIIINPIRGTVLTKYAEENEITTPARPLYRIADLSTLILRAYFTGDQLPGIRVGQEVTVLADAGDGKWKSLPGHISWISDKAEFTPKTIQTRDERANLVYAVKIRVKNDGSLKTGMYAEVKL